MDLLKTQLGEVYYVLMVPELWSESLESWWKSEVAVPSPAPMGLDVSRSGIITIPAIVQFCNDNGLQRTLEVVQHNEGQLYLQPVVPGDAHWTKNRRLCGVSVVYAPEINSNTSLHFSWDGEGCALRDYSAATPAKPPVPHRKRKTSQVVPLITKELLSIQELAIHRIAEWREVIESQNGLWGVGRNKAPPV